MPNWGFAPYQESAFKTALRLVGAAGRGIAGAQGVEGALPSFGAGFTASAKASDAARMAAEQYALRQEESRRRAEEFDLDKQYKGALIKRAEKPDKPERTLSTELQELRDALGREPTEKEKQIKLGIYKEPPAGREPRVNPRSKIAEAEEALGRKLTEEEKLVLVGIDPKQGDPKTPQFIAEQVRLINSMDPNDPEDRKTLQEILANPPSKEEYEAANRKLMVRPGVYRR